MNTYVEYKPCPTCYKPEDVTDYFKDRTLAPSSRCPQACYAAYSTAAALNNFIFYSELYSRKKGLDASTDL